MKQKLKILAAVFSAAALTLTCACAKMPEKTQAGSPSGASTEEPSKVISSSENSVGGSLSKEQSPEETTATEPETEVREVQFETIPLEFNEKDLVAAGTDASKAPGAFCRYDCWVSTDYIDVSRYAALTYELAAHRYLYSAAFFDENKVFISGKATESVIGYTLLIGHTPVPEGAKYARFAQFTGSGEYTHVDEDVFVSGILTEEDYALYRSSLRHDGLKIVCLGDSLTEGDWGLAPGIANKHYLNYPYYLAKIMGCETVNNGRCGYTASGYEALYGSGTVNVKDADVVLIMLGTNGGLTVDGSKQRSSYRSLIASVKNDVKKGCKVVLLTPPHATTIVGKPNYGYGPWVENAAKEVRKMAAQYHFDLIDVYAESPIREENESIYQPTDGLHMTAAGYEALAKFLAEKIEELLK